MPKKTYFSHEVEAVAADGLKRTVTVVGCRYYTNEEVWDDEKTVTDKTTDFHFVVSKQKTGYLELAYSIRHNEDVNDPEIGINICKRRIKHGDAYLTYNTAGNCRPYTCAAIVKAEAEHIASKVDSFIKKLMDRDGSYVYKETFE